MIDRDCRSCVFCASATLELAYEQTVLGRSVRWERCTACQSIQISRVDWLEEAYRPLPQNLDTGYAQRSILCSLFIRSLRAVGLLAKGAKILDFGAGNGLLVRLLRDQGFAAYGYDRYVRPSDCAGFTVDAIELGTRHAADLVTVVDVLEHLTQPRQTLACLAANLAPGGMVLLRTPLHDPARHGADWEYLAPDYGQHISFFSREGLRCLARSADLEALVLPLGFLLLARSTSAPGHCRRAALNGSLGLHLLLARAIGLCCFSHATADSRRWLQKLAATTTPKTSSGKV